MILYRIAKSLLRKGHGKDLVQLNLVNTMGPEGETHCWGGGYSLRWYGEHILIYMGVPSIWCESTKLGYIGWGHSPPPTMRNPVFRLC